MNGVLTNDEVRDLAIKLLLAPTARDAQTRIGASDVANQCDRCLALAFQGTKRVSQQADRLWLGRTYGTAFHRLIEDRQNTLEWFAEQFPGAKAEEHIWFHEFRGYGRVGGSIDILLDWQIIDPKGLIRKKMALLEDYLQRQGAHRVGLEPRWTKQKRGNYKLDLGSGMVASLSEREYEHEMVLMAYKLNGYYGQQTCYLHGLVQMGHKARTGSLLFFSRDGNGYHDLPTVDTYTDPTKLHDLFAWSFRYVPEHAAMILDRAQWIYDRLEAGETIADFSRHDLCWRCSMDLEQEKRDADVVAMFPGSIESAEPLPLTA